MTVRAATKEEETLQRLNQLFNDSQALSHSNNDIG